MEACVSAMATHRKETQETIPVPGEGQLHSFQFWVGRARVGWAWPLDVQAEDLLVQRAVRKGDPEEKGSLWIRLSI